MTPTPLTLEIRPQFSLAALAWGPEDGEPLLALHGWLDNAATHARLIPLLPDYLRVVALDFAGHGHSDHRPAAGSYHYVENVMDVLRAADALGWDRFHLMGHSMGAGIASLLAGASPQRVNRLILLEGIGPMTTPPAQLPALMERSLHAMRELEGRSPRVYASRAEARERLARANTSLTEPALDTLVERGTRETPEGVVFRHDLRLRGSSMYRFTEPQVHAYLSAITAPTLLVRATRGWPFDADVVAARAASITQREQLEVEGGHHVHLDHPERIAETVSTFVSVEAKPSS